MSAFGTKRISRCTQPMSAFGGKADIEQVSGHRLGPSRLRLWPAFQGAEERGPQQIGAMCNRVSGGGGKLFKVFGPRKRVLLFHSFLVRNGLLLHEFDVQGPAMAVV